MTSNKQELCLIFYKPHSYQEDQIIYLSQVKGKIGESGDRIVTIQTFGESGYPTMKIIRQSIGGIEDADVVVYMKNSKTSWPE